MTDTATRIKALRERIQAAEAHAGGPGGDFLADFYRGQLAVMREQLAEIEDQAERERAMFRTLPEEQRAFLTALADDEDDTLTRMVYADWLDDHDQPEEAARQRAWPAAKAWLVGWVKSINYDDDEGPHAYADALEAGYEAVSGRGYTFGTDAGADYFREGDENREAFFKNWSVVTGVPVPGRVVEMPPFRCAC